MQPLEGRILSFVAKIWLEESEEDPGVTELHGHVTHVGSGERHYIKTVNEVPMVIRAHLQRMGIRLRSDPWAPRWLRIAREFARKRSGREGATCESAALETRELWEERVVPREAGRIENRDRDTRGGVPSGREVRHEV